jgi:hypothetical protein
MHMLGGTPSCHIYYSLSLRVILYQFPFDDLKYVAIHFLFSIHSQLHASVLPTTLISFHILTNLHNPPIFYHGQHSNWRQRYHGYY